MFFSTGVVSAKVASSVLFFCVWLEDLFRARFTKTKPSIIAAAMVSDPRLSHRRTSCVNELRIWWGGNPTRGREQQPRLQVEGLERQRVLKARRDCQCVLLRAKSFLSSTFFCRQQPSLSLITFELSSGSAAQVVHRQSQPSLQFWQLVCVFCSLHVPRRAIGWHMETRYFGY